MSLESPLGKFLGGLRLCERGYRALVGTESHSSCASASDAMVRACGAGAGYR